MKKVLIVDDSKVSRKVNIKALIEIGYETIGEAVDGLEGIEMLNTFKPDLIISDIEMPNLDGISMLKKIRENGDDIPVIMVSSIVNKHMLQEVFKLKATVIKKPLKTTMLVNAIKLIER